MARILPFLVGVGFIPARRAVCISTDGWQQNVYEQADWRSRLKPIRTWPRAAQIVGWGRPFCSVGKRSSARGRISWITMSRQLRTDREISAALRRRQDDAAAPGDRADRRVRMLRRSAPASVFYATRAIAHSTLRLCERVARQELRGARLAMFRDLRVRPIRRSGRP